MFIHATVVLILAVAAQGQVLGPGPCPDLQVVQNFDVAAYLGKWYQVMRYPNAFEFGNCSTAEYGPVDADGKVKVHNEEIVLGQVSGIDGTAELANSSSTEAKLIVHFGVPSVNETVADYWVLGTDYENFSLVWACRPQSNFFNSQSAWVLARRKPLTPEIQAVVEDLIAEKGIRRDHFAVHDTSECTTVP